MKFAFTMKEVPAETPKMDFMTDLRIRNHKAIIENYQRKIDNLVSLERYEDAEEWALGLLGKLREFKKQ